MAGLLSATNATAQTTYTWNSATGGAWTDASNWNPPAVPTGGTNTATIDDTVGGAHSQAVTYDVGGANRTIGTLNVLNSAGATFTDTLQLTSTVANSTTSRLTVSTAITLGSAAGTAEIRLSPLTTANATAVLTAAQGLSVNSGGLLTLDASALSTGVALVNANTSINSGGTLSVLGSSAAGGIGVNTGNANTLTLGSGGLITFNATGTSTTGRLQLFGNFTTNGGTIRGSTNTTGANQIELYGVTNNIGSGTTFTSTGGAGTAAVTFSLRTAGQTLTSAVDLPNVLVRSGTAASPVNLVLTSPGQNVALLTLGTAAGYLKLGSNVNTPAVPVMSITGSTLDLGGFALTSSATTGSFAPTAASTLTNSQGTGTLLVPSFNFGTGATVNTVSGNVTLVAAGSPAGAQVTNTVGSASVSATSTIAITGTSDATNNGRIGLVALGTGSTVGTLQIGSGASTTFVQLQTGAFTIQGNLSVLTGGTVDLQNRTHSVTGKLQGGGTITGSAATVNFTSNGGFSPGFGAGSTGSGFVGMLTLAGTQTMNFVAPSVGLPTGSVSVFDLASDISFDSLVASGNLINLNGSTLSVNLLNGYNPAQGTTWNLLTGLGAGTTQTFGTINSNVPGDIFSFSIVGTNGVLTLTSTAVPEPST